MNTADMITDDVAMEAFRLSGDNKQLALRHLIEEAPAKCLSSLKRFSSNLDFIQKRVCLGDDALKPPKKTHCWPLSFEQCTMPLRKAMNRWIKDNFQTEGRSKCLILIGPTSPSGFGEITVMDGYSKHRLIHVGIPAIVLMNPEDQGSLFGTGPDPVENANAPYWRERAVIYVMGQGDRFHEPKPVQAPQDDSDSSAIEQLKEFQREWLRDQPKETQADAPTASSITFLSTTSRISVVDLYEAEDAGEEIEEVVQETIEDLLDACTSTPPSETLSTLMDSCPVTETLECLTDSVQLVLEVLEGWSTQ